MTVKGFPFDSKNFLKSFSLYGMVCVTAIRFRDWTKKHRGYKRIIGNNRAYIIRFELLSILVDSPISIYNLDQ